MFGKKKSVKYDFYLGGPMRGYPDLNKKMFALVALMLRQQGFTVWSPSEHDSYLKLSFGECMTNDLNAVINECCKIALLPGWQESLGANAEAFVAFVVGCPAVEVLLYDNNNNCTLVPFALNLYRLPYGREKIDQFDPHRC